MTPLLKQRGRAPVPDVLPGDFFVLSYDRENEAFVLRVDDQDHSTYDLGDDVREIQALFNTRRAKRNGAKLEEAAVNRMLDIARELGMAQYIPELGEYVPDRVLSILPRKQRTQGLNFDDQETNGWVGGLRRDANEPR